MRKMFLGYHRPTEAEFAKLWQEATFGFDANVLLNIYRYTEPTSEAFLSILEKLKPRIWLPHQAAQEYQDNRLNVISKQLRAYAEVSDLIDKELLGKVTNLENDYSRHPLISIKELTADIREAAEKLKQELRKRQVEHPDYVTSDSLRDKLTELFDGKVGPPFTDEQLEKLYKEADKRFERKLPPGYQDHKKEDGKKYGDFILWRQIIDHATSTKKPFVLITDDR